MGDAEKRLEEPSKERLGITDLYLIEDEKFNASSLHSIEPFVAKLKCEYNI